jgi:hypothetical protein
VPLQLAPELCTMSHATPQALQLVVVLVGVSHPSRSGAVLTQSAQPELQPVYEHVTPLQVAPTLSFVSQADPHAVQLVVVFVGPQSTPASPASGRICAESIGAIASAGEPSDANWSVLASEPALESIAGTL